MQTHGLWDRTITLALSDNGGALNSGASNFPYRESAVVPTALPTAFRHQPRLACPPDRSHRPCRWWEILTVRGRHSVGSFRALYQVRPSTLQPAC